MNKEKNKTYLIAAVFLLVIIILIVAVVWPLIGQIKKSSGELVNDRSATETLLSNWFDIQKSQQDIKKIKDGLDQLRPILSSNDAIEFIKTLEDTASLTKNSEKINIINSEDKQAASLDFQISLQGSFASLMNFLTKVENFSYCGKITAINISGANDQPAGGGGLPAGVKAIISLSVITQ